MDTSNSLRRFEMGLPHLGGLDMGEVLQAQDRIRKGDLGGLSALSRALGKAGEVLAIRKLAAIAGATEVELTQAEKDPSVLAQLEERTAALPYGEAFRQAADFFSEALSSFGVVLGSTVAEEGKQPKAEADPATLDDTPSVD